MTARMRANADNTSEGAMGAKGRNNGAPDRGPTDALALTREVCSVHQKSYIAWESRLRVVYKHPYP